MADRYRARSASDKTDDWPFWFVADMKAGGLNVTAPLTGVFGCIPFLPRRLAELLADHANESAGDGN